jgi:hypothetical protein
MYVASKLGALTASSQLWSGVLLQSVEEQLQWVRAVAF